MGNKYTLIVAAFPGSGKTHCCNNFQDIYKMSDSDSSLFSWTTNEKGEKVRNPNFPNNYIAHIKENIGKFDVIFVSTHETVLDALEANDIDYVLVYPYNSLTNKEIWKNRLYLRGSDTKFVDFILDNWDSFLDSLSMRTKPIHFLLGEKMENVTNGMFLDKNSLDNLFFLYNRE